MLFRSVSSSVYIMKLTSLLASEISLMYIINNRRSNIEPCGTPVIFLFCVDTNAFDGSINIFNGVLPLSSCCEIISTNYNAACSVACFFLSLYRL